MFLQLASLHLYVEIHFSRHISYIFLMQFYLQIYKLDLEVDCELVLRQMLRAKHHRRLVYLPQ